MKARIFQKLEEGNKESKPSPPEQEGGGQCFLSMCPLFQRALEVVPFLKEATKNVHMTINILFTLLLIIFYQVENIKSITYLTVSRMPWVE